MTLPEHVQRNRARWTRWAPEYAKWAPDAWARRWPSERIWKARKLGAT